MVIITSTSIDMWNFVDIYLDFIIKKIEFYSILFKYNLIRIFDLQMPGKTAPIAVTIGAILLAVIFIRFVLNYNVYF